MALIPLLDAVICYHCRVIHDRRDNCPFCGTRGMRVAEVITKLAHHHVWDSAVHWSTHSEETLLACMCGADKIFAAERKR